MRIASLSRGALAAALSVAAAACSADFPTGPAAAPAAAQVAAEAAAAVARHDIALTTPNEGDEAAMLVISGAAVDSVTSPAGAVIVLPGESATRVILSGTLQSGVVATVWTRAGSGTPTVAIEQVTAAGTHAQRALAGYRVDLSQRQ